MYRIFAIGFLLAAGTLVRAGDGELDRATLRGVKEVNIVVDRLDPELEQLGLTPDMLRSRIEGKLLDAAIPVNSNAIAFVGLHVTSMVSRKGDSGLCFSIAFYQPVLLARDQKIRTASPTWNVNAILMVPPKPLVQSALNTAEQLGGLFANAYRAVNPR